MHLTLEQYLEIEKRTKELENQVESLKRYIKERFGVEITDKEIQEEIELEQQVMTASELEQHVKKIEMYSNVFSYGRTEEKKMAESL